MRIGARKQRRFPLDYNGTDVFIRDTHIVFSKHLQAQPFKIPAFSIPQLSFLSRGSFSVNFSHSFESKFWCLKLSPFSGNLLSFTCLCGSLRYIYVRRETVFLYYPSFAALHEKFFASAVQLLGNRWRCASDRKKKWIVF